MRGRKEVMRRLEAEQSREEMRGEITLGVIACDGGVQRLIVDLDSIKDVNAMKYPVVFHSLFLVG